MAFLWIQYIYIVKVSVCVASFIYSETNQSYKKSLD